MSKPSYARGPNAPLLESSISEVFAATAGRFPDNPALIVCHQGIRLTWRELALQVEKIARGLAGLGLAPGDRVGVWASNCLEWILLQFACARAQLVLVNINPAYRSHELRYVLARSGMRALFLWEADDRADYRAILNDARGSQQLTIDHVVYFGQESWSRLLDHPGVLPAGGRHEIANMQYTSGTTGQPKGVLLTHRNLLNNGSGIAGALRATKDDRICVPVPLYHCFGCVIGSMTCAVSGAAMVIPAARFDTRATLEAVENERATALYGVPAMFIAELEHPDFRKFDLGSLRTGVMAGAPCPIEVMKRVMTDMNCGGITIAYGQTESSPVVTMSHVDDAVETRVSTVGCPLPNTEIKIASPAGEPAATW